VLRSATGALGRLLIAGGVLILLFVAYQLWGTGLKEAASQHSLRRQFEASLHAHHSTAANQGANAQAQADAAPPPPEGQAVGIIKIPAISLEKVVVQGVGESDLRAGPGHYPETPLPGQAGNSAIAGHRTTYGAPFFRLNELVSGDPILITTRQGAFRYVVQRSMVVDPSDSAVVAPTPGNHLTLTTCTPRYSAAQRLIVVAVLAGPVAPTSPAANLGAEKGGTPTVGAGSLEGAGSSWLPSFGWGAGFAAAFGFAWWLSRRLGRSGRHRRLLTWLACAPGLGALLFFFFAAVSVLLPAQY
jgi:sortase A